MGSNCIEFSNVYKSFGSNKVLKGLNFTVEKGEIMALLGHNGAGKTTTLRILLGLLGFDSGEVMVFDNKINVMDEGLRQVTGVLSEDTGLYESLTVYDNLKFFSDIYKCDRQFFEDQIDYLLDMFNISDCKHKVIKDFSLGMKKKVAIIRTIFHNPKLVLMDEPINALDPISIQVLHQIMRDMKDNLGTTFVITTHNLDEVVKICDSIVIVKNGKSFMDKRIELSRNETILETHITLYNFKDTYINQIRDIMKDNFASKEYKIIQDKLIIKNTEDEFIAKLIKKLSDKDIGICEVIRNNFDLEQLYIDLNTEE